jgi:hypothetical protein
MANSDDINTKKRTNLQTVNAKLAQAVALRSAGNPNMDGTINQLMDDRDALHLADLQAALDSPELAQALAVISSATTDLNTVAANMVTATSFITNVANFGTKVQAVATAYQGAATAIGGAPAAAKSSG